MKGPSGWSTGGLVACVLASVACLLASVACADDLGFSRAGRGFEQRTGAALYASVCQGCHMDDGRGADGAARYPALAHDVRLAEATYPIVVVLNGHRNMPAFARTLDDAQVAAVVMHVRTHFGNAYADPVTPEQVGALRLRDER